MTNPKDWQAGVTGRVAEAVRRFREERGMSAQDVAAACADLGYPIARSIIANLENGRRSSVDVAEVLVLAKVLDVPPVALVVPVGETGEIEVLPGRMISTDEALQWVCGDLPLDYEPANDTVEERFDEVRRHRQMMYGLQKAISRTEEYRRGAALSRDMPTREHNSRLVAQFDEMISDMSLAIQDLRAEMRAKGIHPPTLPPALAHLDYVETEDAWVHVSEAPADAPGVRPPTDEEIEDPAGVYNRPPKRNFE
ncbi:helix-turn-helix transcriptional regulator [Streptomyces kaniharaensis]|uniref:Helix-turn-helix transcriptional regulator n=1 Tax=Streptomyces kaniharaensis TaxID=212423 RepID=A0A6N7KSR2_9ACTN|nr:helix-turn-helix transcriptional regulator [Streptomyces kaniharaensis]MQS13378.1 helix-turn-helix transcriptional regulator [Streptomyces kaniharaensis]